MARNATATRPDYTTTDDYAQAYDRLKGTEDPTKLPETDRVIKEADLLDLDEIQVKELKNKLGGKATATFEKLVKEGRVDEKDPDIEAFYEAIKTFEAFINRFDPSQDTESAAVWASLGEPRGIPANAPEAVRQKAEAEAEEERARVLSAFRSNFERSTGLLLLAVGNEDIMASKTARMAIMGYIEVVTEPHDPAKAQQRTQAGKPASEKREQFKQKFEDEASTNPTELAKDRRDLRAEMYATLENLWENVPLPFNAFYQENFQKIYEIHPLARQQRLERIEATAQAIERTDVATNNAFYAQVMKLIPKDAQSKEQWYPPMRAGSPPPAVNEPVYKDEQTVTSSLVVAGRTIGGEKTHRERHYRQPTAQEQEDRKREAQRLLEEHTRLFEEQHGMHIQSAGTKTLRVEKSLFGIHYKGEQEVQDVITGKQGHIYKQGADGRPEPADNYFATYTVKLQVPTAALNEGFSYGTKVDVLGTKTIDFQLAPRNVVETTDLIRYMQIPPSEKLPNGYVKVPTFIYRNDGSRVASFVDIPQEGIPLAIEHFSRMNKDFNNNGFFYESEKAKMDAKKDAEKRRAADPGVPRFTSYLETENARLYMDEDFELEINRLEAGDEEQKELARKLRQSQQHLKEIALEHETTFGHAHRIEVEANKRLAYIAQLEGLTPGTAEYEARKLQIVAALNGYHMELDASIKRAASKAQEFNDMTAEAGGDTQATHDARVAMLLNMDNQVQIDALENISYRSPNARSVFGVTGTTVDEVNQSIEDTYAPFMRSEDGNLGGARNETQQRFDEALPIAKETIEDLQGEFAQKVEAQKNALNTADRERARDLFMSNAQKATPRGTSPTALATPPTVEDNYQGLPPEIVDELEEIRKQIQDRNIDVPNTLVEVIGGYGEAADRVFPLDINAAENAAVSDAAHQASQAAEVAAFRRMQPTGNIDPTTMETYTYNERVEANRQMQIEMFDFQREAQRIQNELETTTDPIATLNALHQRYNAQGQMTSEEPTNAPGLGSGRQGIGPGAGSVGIGGGSASLGPGTP